MIRFACSTCGKLLKAPPEMAGKNARCSTCSASVAVPNVLDEDVPVVEAVESATTSAPQMKYCLECGKRIRLRAVICPECGVSQSDVEGRTEKHCHECGEIIRGRALICPKCGCEQSGSSRVAVGNSGLLGVETNRVTVGICAILLGALGVHKFILGYNQAGIIMVLVSVVGLFFGGALVMSVIGIIEGVKYLSMSDLQFREVHGKLQRPWF